MKISHLKQDIGAVISWNQMKWLWQKPLVISTLHQHEENCGKLVSCRCVLVDDAKWCGEVLKGAEAKLAKGYKMFTVQDKLE